MEDFTKNIVSFMAEHLRVKGKEYLLSFPSLPETSLCEFYVGYWIEEKGKEQQQQK